MSKNSLELEQYYTSIITETSRLIFCFCGLILESVTLHYYFSLIVMSTCFVSSFLSIWICQQVISVTSFIIFQISSPLTSSCHRFCFCMWDVLSLIWGRYWTNCILSVGKVYHITRNMSLIFVDMHTHMH